MVTKIHSQHAFSANSGDLMFLLDAAFDKEFKEFKTDGKRLLTEESLVW